MAEHIAFKHLETADEETQAKSLILEYMKWLNIDLCFQDIESELSSFPQRYSGPDGAFIVAKDGSLAVGCVAIKKLEDGVCEMKRLFVKDAYKGRGIGKKLVGMILDEAKKAGYKKIRLDTLDVMQKAAAIYRKNGFYEIAPYYHNPYKGTLYLERAL